MLFCRSLNASIGYGFAMESDVNEKRSAADVKRVEGVWRNLILVVGGPQLAQERGKWCAKRLVGGNSYRRSGDIAWLLCGVDSVRFVLQLPASTASRAIQGLRAKSVLNERNRVGDMHEECR